MPRKPKQHKLTVLLLKEEVSLDQALRDDKELTGYKVEALDSERDSLFTLSNPPHPPGWSKYVEPHVSGGLGALLTASASAALLFEAKDRVWAFTFGGGRHLLERDAFVQDFGLRVVLNKVAPDQLKSVDAKTIDDTTVHTRRALSHESSFSAFGLDVSRDLLRAVTGRPEDETFSGQLTGADALGIHTRVQLPELPALVERLLDAYEDETYKENFDFIDHLRPEKSQKVINELNGKLVEALQNESMDDVHLAVPEALDWLDNDGFRYEPGDPDAPLDNDPRISVYLETRKDADIGVEMLKSDKLVAIRTSDGAIADRWSIYESLVYQVDVDDRLYVLSTGDWFWIDKNYRVEVEEEVRGLDSYDGLPSADAGTDEPTYNVKAAEALDALCLDQKFVFEAGHDKQEICDILTRSGGLIHVKQRGSSSTLSHLFTQGLNSAERLLFDKEFRSKARAVAEKADPAYSDVLPEDRIEPGNWEITFAVITRSSRSTPLTLPFFSVISLRSAASRLLGYGFKVSTAQVREGE